MSLPTSGCQTLKQELLKAQLTLQIYRIIKQRGLTQIQAAKALGIKQPHVSLLMRNRSGTFSVGRLIDFLTALGQDVEIIVRPTRKQQGAMSGIGVVTVSSARLSGAQLASMVRLREARQPKVSVIVRLDARVLAWLKSKGAGHLTRINDALVNLMQAEQGTRPRT